MSIDLQIVNQRQNPQVERFVFDQLNRLAERFDNRLANVQVRIQHDGQARHGGDKRCSIDTNLSTLGAVHVSAQDTNVYEAIHKAMQRLGKLIAKKTSRRDHTAVRHHLPRKQLADQD